MESRVEKVYETIRRQLLTGDLNAGDVLHARNMAKSFGVSLTPVREALILLKHDGLVEQVPRYGTFVRTPALQELLDTYELRRVLNVYGVAQAARCPTEDGLAELSKICDSMHQELCRLKNQNDIDPLTVRHNIRIADAEFHLVLLRMAGNRRHEKLVYDSFLFTQLYVPASMTPEQGVMGESSRIWLHHTRILRAVRSRDPERARRVTIAHYPPIKDLVARLLRVAEHQHLCEDLAAVTPDALRMPPPGALHR